MKNQKPMIRIHGSAPRMSANQFWRLLSAAILTPFSSSAATTRSVVPSGISVQKSVIFLLFGPLIGWRRLPSTRSPATMVTESMLLAASCARSCQYSSLARSF